MNKNQVLDFGHKDIDVYWLFFFSPPNARIYWELPQWGYLYQNIRVKPNFAGLTPLHQVVESDNAELVKLLLSAGANVNVKPDLLGNTPLSIAQASENQKILTLLLASGAGK